MKPPQRCLTPTTVGQLKSYQSCIGLDLMLSETVHPKADIPNHPARRPTPDPGIRRTVSVTKTIVYEQPLNERTRTLLRLEHLFKQMAHHMRGGTVWDSRSVLTTLMDVLSIFARSDLKSEVMKEMERHTANLSRMKQVPGVDHERLEVVLGELASLTDRLYAQKGQTAAELRRNEFLKTIMQRSSIPGGSCDFDVPVYHWWLKQPVERRNAELNHWLSSFDLIAEAVDTILRLTRQSGNPNREIAEGGFFQQSLDANIPCQLVRVAVDERLPYFAEISGGKHRFTVRFIAPSADGRQVQAEQDIPFELSRCVI